MAFDTSPNKHTPGSASPEAPRPSTAAWNSLRDDGIQWQGQVLLAGVGAEIPALLVLTANRLTLVISGENALEVPRAWLRPEPKLLIDSGVRISITPLGGSSPRDATDHLTLSVRDGRGASARLVGTISGRLISPREERGAIRSDSPHGWSGSIGAAASLALPPLPDFGADAVTPRAAASWPPIEQHGLPPATPSGPAETSRRETSSTSISAWTAAHLPEILEPGNPAEAWGRTQPGRAARRPAKDIGVPPTVIEERHQFNRGLVWGLRALIMAVLVGTAAWFGRDSLPAHLEFSLPANLEQRFGFADDPDDRDIGQVPAAEPTKPSSDGTSGPPNRDLIGGTSDDEEVSVGGSNGEITPVNPGIGVLADPITATQANAPAEPTQPTVDPTLAPIVPTTAPVEPTSEPIAPTAPPATVEPTQAPATDDATEVPATEQPTEAAPTDASTEVPSTEGPTEVPGRQDSTEAASTVAPTEVPATEQPTDVPSTEAPVATLESQPASVNPGTTPEQSLASGTFRYTITGASRGETVPELPEINSVGGYGEWVVLSVYGENWSDTEQVFDMSEFQLFADGEEILIDVGNEWVGGLLGYTPAYGNTDAILWAADEGHEFALTFLAPPGAQQLTLVAGDQAIDLSAALTEPRPLAQNASNAIQPEHIEVDVVEVVDAETIVIELDGIEQTVRYLGLDVPTDDDCYADDATAFNRDLVEGKTVRLERQATDVDARGNWVRDVWAPAADGRFFLVSEELVSEGAATVGISEPNTRYEGWLLGSQSVAKAEQRGLWGACAEEVGEITTSPQVVAPRPDRITALRKPPMHITRIS